MAEKSMIDVVNDTRRDMATVGDFANTKDPDQKIESRLGNILMPLVALQKHILDTGAQGFPDLVTLKKYVPSIPFALAKDMSTRKFWMWQRISEDGVEPEVFEWRDTGQSDLDLANENTKKSLMSGKPYPFKQMERGGVISEINTPFANLILDIKVVNPQVGKVYKVEIYMNNFASPVGVPTGWGISEYDASTFSESTIENRVYVIDPKDLQEELDRSGVNIINLESKNVAGLQFVIRYDGSTLPKTGFLRSSLPSDDGFSWLIDLICYESSVASLRSEVSVLDQLTINSGKDYPLKREKRDGITSAEGAWKADKVYLNIEVTGAAEDIRGKYFRLAYMQNGATLSGRQRNGVRIEEFDASTYSSHSVATIIHSSSDEEASYDRDAGGIQTFFITPKLRPNINIKVTINVDHLPEKGSAFTSGNLPESSLWSWIIDPDCYVITQAKHVGPEYKSISGIMAIGASLINSVNGWFEKSCSKMDLISINKAVGGMTPYYHADRIYRGVFCTDVEFEDADILTIQYASSKDLDNSDGTLQLYTDYTKDFDINDSKEQFSAKYTHAQTLDYIIKYWRQRCYEQRSNPTSKWFGTKFGKPFRIVFVTHWHDARVYYNEPIRSLAKRWGAYVCELDKNIGFTKENPMPDGSQVSLLYAMDTQEIDGVVYGWHPSRNQEGEYIQTTMCNIFESTVINHFL